MKLLQGHSTTPHQQTVDDAIEWTAYPRIAPGEYFANCYWAGRYRDPGMKRWTCLLRWDVLSDDLMTTIALRIPEWFSLGDGEKPHASRRGKYLREWVRANGNPPKPGDRLSPRVFTGRVARVEIGDTNSTLPYSVVKRIIQWETGTPLCHLVSKSTSQGRQREQTVFTGGSVQ
jgi:hypothetical protein